MSLSEINSLNEPAARQLLTTCCGSARWVDDLLAARPFLHEDDLISKATKCWNSTTEKDWLEAFRHHPKIGDLENLKKKFAATQHLAGAEQSAVNTASEATLRSLAEGNEAYEKRFGFIFIVCATGKSAEEMLALLEQRIHNDRDAELRIAAAEQHKITLLRLKKLLA